MAESASTSSTAPPDPPPLPPPPPPIDPITDTDSDYEDHYLVLDLTVPNPSILSTGPSTNPHVNRASAAAAGAPTIPLPFSKPHTGKSILGEAAGGGNRLQLLELDSEQPLLSYQNRLYTGKWTRTIGSEIHVVLPRVGRDYGGGDGGTDQEDMGEDVEDVVNGRGNDDDEAGNNDGDENGQRRRRRQRRQHQRRGQARRDPHPRRRTGGGYYISAKESTSAASAYLGKNVHRTIPFLRSSGGAEEGEEEDDDDDDGDGRREGEGGGKVLAVVPLGYRVRFTPAVVKPKQRGFREQQKMRGQFIRRLRELQIRKGEAVEDEDDDDEDDDDEGEEGSEDGNEEYETAVEDNRENGEAAGRGGRGKSNGPTNTRTKTSAVSTPTRKKAKPNPRNSAVAEEPAEPAHGAGYFTPGWNTPNTISRGGGGDGEDSHSQPDGNGTGVDNNAADAVGATTTTATASTETETETGNGVVSRDVVELIDELMPDAPPPPPPPTNGPPG